jgi:muramoyltetrapeptide carboxypeptidase
VAIVAPSSPFDHEKVRAGIAVLEERYRVRYSADLYSRDQGFLAGTDAVRLAELQSALDDPEAKAVFLARGGYGVTRIFESLDFRRFVERPRWLVGFSDFTALHLEAARRSVATLHATNVSGLATASAAAQASLIAALESPLAAREHTGLSVLAPGRAEGALFGGNLTLVFTQAAAGALAVPEGGVLFLEDVTETSYRVDRMLTALAARGVFSHVSAVVLGDFTDCSPGKHGVSVESVLAERLSHRGIPVVAGLHSGHGAANEPLHLGFTARVDAAAEGRVIVEPPG